MSSKKITMKDFTTGSKQVLHELRDLQKTGLTLPDIIYNYRIDEGHLVRKRYREGSESGSDREDDDEPPYDPEKSKANVDAFLNSTPTSTPNPKPEPDRNAQVEDFLRPGEFSAPDLPPRPNLPPYSVFDPAASYAVSNAGPSSKPNSNSEVSPDVKVMRITRKPIPAPVPKKQEQLKEQAKMDEGGLHKDKHVKFGSIRVIGDGAKGRKMIEESSEDTLEKAYDKEK